MLVFVLRCRLTLRRRCVLLRLWSCLTLRSRLPLRSCRACLRLWGHLALRLGSRLALWLWCRLALWRRLISLPLRRSLIRLRLLWLRRGLALRRLLIRWALRWWLIRLPLLWLWRGFALRCRFARLLLRISLPLCRALIRLRRLRLWRTLALRLRVGLALRRLRSRLALLLLPLFYFPIGCPQRRWGLHVVIGRKRRVDGHMSGAAMIRAGKLATVCGGSALILQLRLHGRSVLLMHRRQFRWPRRRPYTARSPAVTHMRVVVVRGDPAVIDVMLNRDVDVVD